MKRIFKIIFTYLTVMMIPCSLILGQDNKSEQKIKIIVDDGSGTRVVIDTVIKDSPKPDSIMLKDSSVVYLKHPGDVTGMRHHKGKKHVFVTYSANGKDNGNEGKDISVISSETKDSTQLGDNKNVTYYSRSESREERGGRKYRIITRNGKDNCDKGETVYINEDNSPDEEIEKSVNVSVSDSDNDSTIEKTKYVIAKDGMVVTIEGNDETKAKELVKEIELRLGVNNDKTENKETMKIESKKIIKK
jgi:hypothetical protein